jgi:hypothetical protein
MRVLNVARALIVVAGIAAGPALLPALGLAAIAEKVGAVSKIRPLANISLQGKTQVAASGMPVHHKDVLMTGARARLEVSLIDNTKITLGENASLVIDEFVYNPAGENVVSAAVKGAFRFTTGLLSKAKDRQVMIQTPVAALSIRGTDFWGGPLDGTYGVLVLEGEVRVTTSAGTVVLDRPGQGVTISAADAAPGAPAIWSADRVNRAFATISF